MSQIPTTARYEFMDAVRGLAALIVVMAHALQFSQFTTLWNGHFDWIKYGHIGEAGVVLFFFASGFVIPLSLEKSGNLRYFWINRALRIYPLYFFVYFLTLAATNFGGITGPADLLWNFLAHVAFIQEFVKQENFVGGSWTLSLELFWYIGFALLFMCKINRSLKALMIITVVGCLAAQLITIYLTRLPMGRLSMLITCVFGLIHYRWMQGQIDKRSFIVCSAVMWITIAANIASRDYVDTATVREPYIWQLSPWIVAYLVFISAFLSRGHQFWSHMFMGFIGRISYSLYLMHALVMIYLARMGIDGVLFIAATYFIAIPLATLAYKYIESPPIKFGKAFHPKNLRGAVAVSS